MKEVKLSGGKIKNYNKNLFAKPKDIVIQKACCEKHGEYEDWINEISGESSGCPLCLLEKEKDLKEQQKQQDKINEILNKVDNLPKKYKHAGFKNFDLTPEKQKAFNTALAFSKNPQNKWLIMLGKNGTGKTHLAHAILKVTGGIFRDFGDITDELLDAQAGFGIGRCELIKKYSQTPMLVIDEVDKVKKTDGRLSWLNKILNNRYNEMLPTIIIGNIDVKSFCELIDINNGQAMRDRIDEVGIVVSFDWESYRKRLRNAESVSA